MCNPVNQIGGSPANNLPQTIVSENFGAVTTPQQNACRRAEIFIGRITTRDGKTQTGTTTYRQREILVRSG